MTSQLPSASSSLSSAVVAGAGLSSSRQPTNSFASGSNLMSGADLTDQVGGQDVKRSPTHIRIIAACSPTHLRLPLAVPLSVGSARKSLSSCRLSSSPPPPLSLSLSPSSSTSDCRRESDQAQQLSCESSPYLSSASAAASGSRRQQATGGRSAIIAAKRTSEDADDDSENETNGRRRCQLSSAASGRCSQSKAASLLSIEQALPRTFSASAIQGSRPLRLGGSSARGPNSNNGAGAASHPNQQQHVRFSFWESMAAGTLTASRWQVNQLNHLNSGCSSSDNGNGTDSDKQPQGFSCGVRKR